MSGIGSIGFFEDVLVGEPGCIRPESKMSLRASCLKPTSSGDGDFCEASVPRTTARLDDLGNPALARDDTTHAHRSRPNVPHS